MTLYTNTHPVLIGDNKCSECGKPVDLFIFDSPTEPCPVLGGLEDQAVKDLLVNLELWQGALPLDDEYHRGLLAQAIDALQEQDK